MNTEQRNNLQPSHRLYDEHRIDSCDESQDTDVKMNE